MERFVYLDNNTTTQVAPEVVEAMTPYFTREYGHPTSIHTLGLDAADALRKSRETIARAIGADSEEVVFTSGATEADDIAIRGAAHANRSRGNHIITTKVEHPSVLRVCEELEKEGFRVDYVGVDREGFVRLDELAAKLDEKTILVSVMHVNDEIGTIEPIEEISALIHKANPSTLLHVDAAAGFTKAPVDIRRGNIDLLSLSAHKIHGPKGVGALFVRSGLKVSNVGFGYVSTTGLRPGTENIPGIVGFAKAAELGLSPEANVRMAKLRDRLIGGTESQIPDALLNGPRGAKRSPNNVNFCFYYIEGESVLLHLDLLGIAVSTGSSCATHKLEPSHVLTAIGIAPENSHGNIRMSFSRYNTEEDVDYVLKVLPEVVENLRKMSPLRRSQNQSARE